MKGSKLEYLESTRGLAALIVVFTHFAYTFYPQAVGLIGVSHSKYETWLFRTPLGILIAGNFAVCLFFVLSGYVLTRAYFRAREADVITTATLKRYFRLMPPVVAATVFSYLLLRFGLYLNASTSNLTSSTWLASLFTFSPSLNNALQQAFYGVFVGHPSVLAMYDPVLWTMRLEFLGSLLVFATAVLVGRYPVRYVAYAVLALFFMHTYYLGFIIGLVLADLGSSQSMAEVRSTGIGWAYALALIAGGLVLGAFPSGGDISTTWYAVFPHASLDPAINLAFWHTIGAGLCIIGILAWPKAQQLLNSRPLVALGKLSFPLYLIHMPILFTFSSYLFKSLLTSHSYNTSVAVTLAVTLAVLYPSSWLFAKFIDAPSVQLSRQAGKILTADSSLWWSRLRAMPLLHPRRRVTPAPDITR